MSERFDKWFKGWPLAVGVALCTFVLGLDAGWRQHKRDVAAEGPKFPWVKIGSTNTVTITNRVTQYVLEIRITEARSGEWTNRNVIIYKGVNPSVPFDVNGEILTIGME